MKATVVLTVEAAVLAAVVATLGDAAFARSILGLRLTVVLLGITASAVAAAAAFLVVIPQLGPRASSGESHFLYFGHLHRWDADRLAEQLTALTSEQEITQLAAQLTVLGRINQRKYRLLRVSVVSALIGATLLVTAFAWPW